MNLRKNIILLIFLSMGISLIAQLNDKKLNVSFDKVSLSEAIKKIEGASKYTFFYDAKKIDLNQQVSLFAENLEMQDAITTMLSSTSLTFEISSFQIALYPKESKKKSNSGVTKVSGIVTDKKGEPIIGATVQSKSGNDGTITDIDGKFTLSASVNSIVLVSYIGYVSKQFEVTEKGNVNIFLQEDNKLLNEVIVVGYGTQKKSVVTGSIASVSGAQLTKQTPTRIDNVLKGEVSGVTITQSSGQPGEGSRVRVRGIGTINNSEPLYIVDGMPIDGGIDYLNPSDIQSVEVLKDAASGAVYGARAANGVILVSTKSGSVGKTSADYRFSYGIQNPWKKRQMLDASEYQLLMNEAQLNAGKPIIYPNPKAAGKGTDWQDETFNYNAPIQNHQVSINGGSNKAVYFLSFSHLHQEGIVGGNFNRSNYKRWNIRLNNTYNVFDLSKERNYLSSAKIGSNISYARTKSTGVATNSEWGTPLGSALLMSPLLPVYATDPIATLNRYPNAIKDAQGVVYTIAGDQFNEITNPIAQLQLPAYISNSDKIVVNFWGELELLKNLKFKSSFGNDLAFWGTDGFTPPYYLGPTNSSDISVVSSSMARSMVWQIENTLSYQKKIFENHNIALLLGQSAKESRGRNLWGQNINLQNLDPEKANLNFAQGTLGDMQTNGGSWRSTLASYFGRLSYNFDEKYMFEATVRRDGSSNFGYENHWAVFPAVSIGWVATQENFMASKPDFLDFVKLRASWGKNGNESIGQFKYTTAMNGGSNYSFGIMNNEAVSFGAYPAGLSNPKLRWEESEQLNFGTDIKLFNNALNITAEWFNKRTNGMLMNIPLPVYTGTNPPIGNVGIMENSGVEFDILYQFKLSDVKFKVSANASYIHNELINLGNANGWANYDLLFNVGTITRAQNGMPFPYFYGKKTDGIFQTIEEVNSYKNVEGNLIQPYAVPGDVRFVDMNSDGKINEDDKTYLGKGMPDWTYGFNLSLDWKGLDCSASINGTIGNQVFDGTRRLDVAAVNLPSYMLERWVGVNSSNKIPRMSFNSSNGNWLSSDLYIHDGSFMRLRNMQVGYTFPPKLSKKFMINNFRVYVAAENLLTITKYHGFDPEISSGGVSLGVDRGIYPQAKTFLFGVNITI